jgi:ectoine hydroxylase-related dioxygenase (phytanoyl-CoA dioxygenase family)
MNSSQHQRSVERIECDGFTIVQAAFAPDECQQVAHDLDAALAACSDEATSLRRANGAIYGARNLLEVFPAAKTLWRRPPLLELLADVLGGDFGLVRGLYFNKPPDGNWSLPWHQDLTIAVADHSLPSERFRNRTMKAGVPHVEAPDELLQRMLTLRIHLGDVTAENGPLQVLPGSHVGRDARPSFRSPVTILAAAGDVLAMRPLLSHPSASSQSGTIHHRRVIHLEFSAGGELPDGYRWHQYLPAEAKQCREMLPHLQSRQRRSN